jgi:hypothetical protein
MIPLIRPDIMGFIDLLSGLLLLYTVSPVPPTVSELHATFLILKGVWSTARPINAIPLPYFFFVLGGFADIISATILVFGTPPVLMEYKMHLAGGLFLKGVWSMLSFVT